MKTALVKYKPFSLNLEHDGNVYEGRVTPVNDAKHAKAFPTEFTVTLNGIFRGVFYQANGKWESTSLEDRGFVEAIGKLIYYWYE